jgi:YfiH family protein
MKLKILKNNNLFGAKHGFFTRLGGESTGIYKGLNCGLGSMDNKKIIHRNRVLVANSMGISQSRLVFVHQIHSSDVITIKNKIHTSPVKGDALVTANKKIALSILTADCQPVLFLDKKNGIIGAAHAGWKGAFTGILQNTIKSMKAIGSEPDHISVTIGPSISQKNYEVGPEFFDTLCKDYKYNEKFFFKGNKNRFHFDLVGYSIYQIKKSGVRKVNYVDSCTYENPDLYFSYRRSVHKSEPDYGRMISTIMLED